MADAKGSGFAVVLNGASSSGKSTIAAAIRARWRRPLQISGIDTFLVCQAESFFGLDGRTAPGFSWVATVVAGVPAFTIEPGPLGPGLVRAAHAYWRACADAGIHQVIDDVWLQPDWAQDLQKALAGVPVVWVGVRCPIHVIEQRERDRGDRIDWPGPRAR